MDKIAIIVQRYGLDINGGAEAHARMLAERLNEKYNVEVLTTTAQDYAIWKEYYREGEEVINDVKVKRFKTYEKTPRKERALRRYLSRKVKNARIKKNLKNLLYFSLLKIRYRKKDGQKRLFNDWLVAQGPYVPDMIKYITDNSDKYIAFIFFTYLHYPTAVGIRQIGDKSIFIPTAHDEPAFYFEEMKNVFTCPKFIMYNTIAEMELVHNTYPDTTQIKHDVAGVGFDKPESISEIKPDYKYILYIGRIDKQKGCKELLEFFTYYKSVSANNLKLVLIGNNYMEEKISSDDIIFTGFISDEDKFAYLQYSEALVMPSRFESFSMVTIEAMLMGKPVLVTKYGEVIKKHVENSNAGFIYGDKSEFVSQVDKIINLSESEKAMISDRGMAYAEGNYSWSTIIGKFDAAIDYVKQ